MLLTYCHAIACCQLLSVDCQFALSNVEPRRTVRKERVRDRLAALELRDEQVAFWLMTIDLSRPDFEARRFGELAFALGNLSASLRRPTLRELIWISMLNLAGTGFRLRSRNLQPPK